MKSLLLADFKKLSEIACVIRLTFTNDDGFVPKLSLATAEKRNVERNVERIKGADPDQRRITLLTKFQSGGRHVSTTL